ncbi:MAG: DTW domain-containing protein YfiP [Candidatus Azotimanducaceae bacterium]|jgi:DTW domain-containing protein YfiP
MMNIVLLTHQRERFKKTNAGSLVAEVLVEKHALSSEIEWHMARITEDIQPQPLFERFVSG